MIQLNTLLTCVLAISCLMHPSSAAESTNATNTKPNIVFILSDDQGFGDLSSFGSKTIQTPKIDTLAEGGMKFTSFYVHNRCTPTRAALMTGSYAERVDMTKVVYRWEQFGLNPDEITVAELLQDAGYTTSAFGKWHLGDWDKFNPVNHGFDYFYGFLSNDEGTESVTYENLNPVELPDPKDKFGTMQILPKSLEFIRKNKNKPFFLYYASQIPHYRWTPHANFEGSSEQGAYGDCMRQLDWAVGEILNELELHGLMDNTLIIFASDNGPQLNRDGHGSAGPLRDGKWTDFEGGIRVPCLMKWPGKIPAGTVNHEITTIMDFLPTFGAIAGYATPDDRVIDGKNILPYMLGETPETPIREVFHSKDTIRYQNWKLILNNMKPGGKGKAGLQGRKPAKAGSLFNLSEDVGETTDVSDQYPEIVQKLTAMSEAHHAELNANIREKAFIDDYDPNMTNPKKRNKK